MAKHTILLVAARPRNGADLALAEQAVALDSELRRTSRRECFALETRWAPDPLALLRALREVRPTIVHCASHGDRTGLWFPTADGEVRVVPPEAIAQAFEAAGASVKLIVLSSCDSASVAEALLPHVACIVGLSSTIDVEKVQAFVVGFYGALGESESIKAAFLHGNAAISLVGSIERQCKPSQLWARGDVDAASIILVPRAEPSEPSSCECREGARQIPETTQQLEGQGARPQKCEVLSGHKADRTTRRRSTRGTVLVLAAAPIMASLLMFAVWHPPHRRRQSDASLSAVRVSRERSAPNAAGKQGLSAEDLADITEAELIFAAFTSGDLGNAHAWASEYHHGVVAERLHDPESAERFWRRAIDHVEDIRAHAPLYIRPWVLRNRRQPYEALFELLARQDKSVEALTVAEQLHSRTWLDALATIGEIRVRPMLGIAPAVEPLSSNSLFSLLGDREALIYIHADPVLWRFHLKDRKIVEFFKLAVPIETLLDLRGRAYFDEKALDQLGNILIPGDISTSERPLYIVAPEYLSAFPFAALRRSQRYLIQDRPVVRLSGLAALRCSRTRSPVAAPVVIADPKGDLPHARAEGEHAAQVTMATIFTGQDATIASLEQARNARLLHVAAHGEIRAGQGSLRLADGEISSSEIVERHIAPRIAVLAGCATAASEDPEGWGSLSEAFLAAGTRSVVATLAVVSDSETETMMRAFYSAGGSDHPAAALAAAQRSVAQSAQSSPRQWASFAVWGHAEPGDCPED